ncbi:MAG: type I-E CRISPR-associated protein Cse2/CasB [Dialister micraerophilus]|nr:type I-E CRISPR-associated protein Cse2/CasB [Dialister micraerophilus]MDU5301566.1 type I-E CRISPR-associated protein Cse2/CasB [Dialister micraerophilus]
MEPVNIEKKSVYKVTANILYDLASMLNTSTGRAVLANLRNSIGKPITQTVGAWAFIFDKIPEEFQGQYENPSREENAILIALQMYALHQQGNDVSVNISSIDNRWKNIGDSLRSLRFLDDGKGIDRRFNAMITASGFEEIIYHLRQLIKILKSKSEQKINYAKLAEDLYDLQNDYKFEKVRFNWARSYYSNKGEEK